MAKDIAQKHDSGSASPITKRFGNLFKAWLKNPTDASLVAEKILEIAESNSWKLRHPVGPDAIPFLEWRKSLNDEEWVNWNAASDEDWYNAVEQDFGLNART
jgi:hypothetical protein